MDQLEYQLMQVDTTIEQCEKEIADMEALSRLQDNPDFERIINNGYFKEEAYTMVQMKGSINATEESDRQCDKVIVGIGMLMLHFQTIFHKGRLARQALDEHKETREDILREQLEGGE